MKNNIVFPWEVQEAIYLKSKYMKKALDAGTDDFLTNWAGALLIRLLNGACDGSRKGSDNLIRVCHFQNPGSDKLE